MHSKWQSQDLNSSLLTTKLVLRTEIKTLEMGKERQKGKEKNREGEENVRKNKKQQFSPQILTWISPPPKLGRTVWGQGGRRESVDVF